MNFTPATDLFDALSHVSTSALRLETRDSDGVPSETNRSRPVLHRRI